MSKIKISTLKTEDLIPYENNPRNNQSAIDSVAESIQEFGFLVPIVVDSENVIVAGHTRYEAALQLGLDSVPCVVANELTPEQVKAFRIIDNKTAEGSSWNMLKLSKEILDIDLDLTEFGFTSVELDNLISLGEDFFRAPEIASAPASPNVFVPNTAPQESTREVTDEQVSKAAFEQETQFSKPMTVKTMKVCCPYCGKEFEVD